MVTLSQRVGVEARRVTFHPGRFLLTLLAAPFWLTSWLMFWVLAVTGGVVRWFWAAMRLGWQDARGLAARRGRGTGHWPVRPKAARGAG